MNNEKILEQFHYFNIRGDVDSVYGNWAVSTMGDIINCLYPYAILSIHFHEDDWMKRVKEKFWFRTECEESLKNALERADEIIKRK